jgi:predicted PurR-regulated permease PerM
VVGLLLAYLLDPLVERFARMGLPRWLAVLLVYAITIAIVVAAMAIAIPPLVQQVATFTTELPDIVRLIQYQLDHLNELYDRIGLPVELRTLADSIVAASLDAVHNVDIGFLQPIIDSAASFVTSFFGYLILPAWLFFLLKDRPRLQAALDRALPESWRRDTWAIIGIVHEVFGKWVRGQLILGGVVGVASFIGLTLLGLTVDPIFGRFAVLLAIIAALGELIPIIGPIISAVPAVLLGLTAGPGPALAALALYFAIQQLENNVLVPKIQSDAIDLHPSLIITALIIGGAIFGLLGAILALPVTAAFRDVFKYVFRRASEVGGATDCEPPSAPGEVEAMEAAGAHFAVDAGAESVR